MSSNGPRNVCRVRKSSPRWGRLSSAIAHEIRNPVAVIASALSTASRGNLEESEREEMFGIAAKEAERLEKLDLRFPGVRATALSGDDLDIDR